MVTKIKALARDTASRCVGEGRLTPLMCGKVSPFPRRYSDAR
ncbi:MAG: hypothetical protein QOD66_1972 [Solirubrobacteraceae bacterium]|jgi:hypothetical protein|nr:hypothetical protein [Solirubrobacteraceae bacterium]